LTPLFHAAAVGNLEIIRVLLEHNVDVNSRTKNGQTPMHSAISYRRSKGDYPQVVQFLLEHGANPNARDNNRRTPLHLVSEPWRRLVPSLALELARILLAHGADVDAEDEKGMTPLQVALAGRQRNRKRRKSEMAQFLSEYCSKR